MKYRLTDYLPLDILYPSPSSIDLASPSCRVPNPSIIWRHLPNLQGINIFCDTRADQGLCLEYEIIIFLLQYWRYIYLLILSVIDEHL